MWMTLTIRKHPCRTNPSSNSHMLIIKVSSNHKLY